MRRLHLFAAIAYLGAALALALAVYQMAYRSQLDQIAETGRIRVEQAADRLLGQLGNFRVLINLLARHPAVIEALSRPAPPSAAQTLIENAVLTYGAEAITVTDRGGQIRLVSGARALPQRALLAAARNGRLGLTHTLLDGQRLFTFSRGIIDGAAPALGAVLVTARIDALEFEWGVDPEAIGFFDDAGIVFAANRQPLLLRQDRAEGQADPRLAPFLAHSVQIVGGHEIWSQPGQLDLPQTALVISRAVPQIAMTARGFLDTAPAREAAFLRASLVAALLVLVGLGVLIFALWRQRLSDRLAIEEAANAALEAHVETRTAELRATQHQLVQASKMTALGQMSAGISHELNQPLAAIMNFAENGTKLIDRDRAIEARGNLALIADQVRRIDRIVRNLRGFARPEGEVLEPVDLVAALDASLGLTDTALRDATCTVHRRSPDAPVLVKGGKVRLQQVIVNLLTNALDAMAGQPDPTISVTVDAPPGLAVLRVRDQGPGIAEPARVFEPFYTTKELGASKGLGLGLSISYGIIGSFGGEITCENHPAGGAVFTITLPRPEPVP